MERILVGLDNEDILWLSKESKRTRISRSELIRRAVRQQRDISMAQSRQSDLKRLLSQTQGSWNQGDGLNYQTALRQEWD